MKKQKVTIVIPTYNERDNLLALIPEIKKIASFLTGYSFEILIVDDDSPDGTGEAVRQRYLSSHSVKIVIRKNERGLGTAIKTGIQKATGEIIVGMDADFNHDPTCILKLLAKLESCQLVIATRFLRGGGMEDRARFVGTYLFNIILRYVFGFPATDNASGYYAIRRRDLQHLEIERIYYGYGEYHLRLVYFASKEGYTIGEVPVYYQRRRYGESKSRLWWMAVHYLKEAIRLRFGLPTSTR